MIDHASNDTNGEDGPVDRVDAAFALYLRACDRGELGSRDDFLSQFPDIADQLRDLMTAADLIGQVTRGSPADSSEAVIATPRPRSLPDGETLSLSQLGEEETPDDFSGDDPAATLPMGTAGDKGSGPTLPFDLGDYELLKVLGVGGMGVVYLARQKELERMVAVKMIRSGMLAGEAEVKRFYAEAQAAAKLRHPGIVAVYQFGQRAGHHFFSMEFIDGEDLHRLVARGPLAPSRAAAIVRDVARAIDHAHRCGVLHRDLKPANVMLTADDHVHITDFGLAKHIGVDSNLTGSGVAVGTPHYMAPEQAVGDSDKATERSDVYSLGAILFAALAGRAPIIGDTVLQTLMKVAHERPPSIRSLRREVDVDLEAIVEKCLEKKASKRYASAGDLAADLDRYLAGQSVTARCRGRWQRTVDWLTHIPLVAALLGRSASPTREHRRFQTGLVTAAMVIPVLLLAQWGWHQRSRAALPKVVRLAGGLPGGQYTDTVTDLARVLQPSLNVPCQVIPTGGSWDNRDRLLDGTVDLAPMQASAISGERLRVVAPLYYEVVHVLVRATAAASSTTGSGQRVEAAESAAPKISSVADFGGRPIAVGPEGSGSRRAAELVLDSLRLPADVCPRVVTAWPALRAPRTTSRDNHSGSPQLPDIAMICIAEGSPLVSELLADGRWRLMPLPQVVAISLQHPMLRPMTVQPDVYPAAELPEAGIETVGTTAFLVTRDDVPDRLILAVMQSLYQEPTTPGLIPATQAAEWQGMALHPAARDFYDAIEATLPR